MQYLVSVIHDAPDLATPDEMAAIDVFNDRLKAEGYWMALAAVDRLEDKLAGYHAYHATRADMLRRLGSSQKSRARRTTSHRTGG